MKGKIKSLLAGIGYFFLMLIIQGIVGGFAGAIIGFKMQTQGEAMNMDIITERMSSVLVYVGLIASILTVLILWVIFSCRKLNFKKEILLRSTKNSNLLSAAILGIFIWLVNTSWMDILQGLGKFQGDFEKMQDITGGLVEGNIFVVILVAGIIIPFSEEVIFRGCIFRALNKNMNIVATIIIQAILFGLAHGNLIQGMYTIPLGIILGYVVYRCNSIVPSMIIHMVNNIVAVVISMALSGIEITLPIIIVMLVIGLIGVVLALRFIIKNNPKNKNDYLEVDNTSI